MSNPDHWQKDWSFILVAFLLMLFAVIALLGLLGLAPELGPIVTYVGVLLTAISGFLGILTEKKSKDGRLSRWGWIAIAGVATALCVTVATLENSRRGEAGRALTAAVDARRAVLRQDGMRLHMNFAMDDLVPSEYAGTLAAHPVRDGIIGDPNNPWEWGVTTCHPEFPDLGRHVFDLSDALNDQTVFVGLADSNPRDFIDVVAKTLKSNEVIARLEGLFLLNNFANVTVRTNLRDQLADCKSGIRGDFTQIYRNSEEYRLTQEYLLPDLRLWRRSGEDVMRPEDIDPAWLIVVSSTFLDLPGNDQIVSWGVERIVLELPTGGVLCATGAPAPMPITERFGAIIVQLNRAETWRCRP